VNAGETFSLIGESGCGKSTILRVIAGLQRDWRVLQSYPRELSGGMGQRVMIAIALINDPRVLIADEPTSALDVRLRNQILELLVTQCEQRQMAMLLISHDLPLVAQFCHRVLVMYQGNKVDEMHAAALPTATHPYTRTLWTCRPNAQTYGQMLPTLDRTAMTPEKYHDDC
ncbi:TPA: ATP-binding cassette domain-containing protein, partial [Escherichia coli]